MNSNIINSNSFSRNSIVFLLITLLAFAGLSSCKDKDAVPEKSNAEKIQAQVDNSTFTTKSVTIIYNYGELAMSAIGTDGSVISINMLLPGGKEVGTHKVPYNSNKISVIYSEEEGSVELFSTNQYDDNTPFPGEINITKFDFDQKTFSGSITAKVYRLKDQQERTITMSFEDLKYVLAPGGGAFMTAKADGQEWTSAVSSVNVSGNLIFAFCESVDGVQIGLLISHTTTPGTYTMTESGAIKYRGEYKTASAKDGSITIDQHSQSENYLSGSAEFSNHQGEVKDLKFQIWYED